MNNKFASKFTTIMLPTLLTIIISIILWKLEPDIKISLFWLLLSICVFSFIIFYMSIVIKYYKDQLIISPKVISCKVHDGIEVLLLKQSQLFSINSLVTIYFLTEDDYELMVGLGVVQNIQQNNNIIQVKIMHFLDEHNDVHEKIINNNKHTLKNIQVKPHTSQLYMSNFK